MKSAGRGHRQVAPVAGDDFAGRRRERERQIGDDRQPRRKVRRNQAGDAAQQPEASEQRERVAPHRQPPGPVRNCGQEKPATAAITKPNSISWICHASGSKRVGNRMYPKNMASQMAIATMAQIPAARNIGRKA